MCSISSPQPWQALFFTMVLSLSNLRRRIPPQRKTAGRWDAAPGGRNGAAGRVVAANRLVAANRVAAAFGARSPPAHRGSVSILLYRFDQKCKSFQRMISPATNRTWTDHCVRKTPIHNRRSPQKGEWKENCRSHSPPIKAPHAPAA